MYRYKINQVLNVLKDMDTSLKSVAEIRSMGRNSRTVTRRVIKKSDYARNKNMKNKKKGKM